LGSWQIKSLAGIRIGFRWNVRIGFENKKGGPQIGHLEK
jgi:hypothetical protein